MQLIIRGFAYVFTKLMKISGAESLVASSNIFVGIESTLTVKPYLNRMTDSEICTILTAGMATVASNVLALYVFNLKPQFPTIAGHLVSASLLSAPAALAMSKIIFPENANPETLGTHVKPFYEKENSIFEAIIHAANTGVKMIAGIAALLIAVLGLVALADLVLSGLGGKINSLFGIDFEWSLKAIFGYIFYPFTLILGVPISDAGTVSKIIGERLIVTEVVAYKDLGIALEQNLLQHERSAVITTYALCGFAHLASMAIFVGGISALAPERVRNVGAVAFRALLAATLACLLTACVAGTFFTKGSILLGS
jgi:CNT family concentrative nucleoside transporter